MVNCHDLVILSILTLFPSPSAILGAMHPKTQARRAAIGILVALEERDINFAQALGDWQSRVPDSTRPFARQLTSEVLRWQARIDWSLRPLLKKPLPKLDAPVRAALRLALYERVSLQTPAAVVGNEYSGLMKTLHLTSAAAFVNAIARRLPENWRDSPPIENNPSSYLAIEYSHPAWLVKRYLEVLGIEECRKLLQCNNCIPELSLRVNTTRASRDGVLSALLDRGLEARPGSISSDAILVKNSGDPTAWPQWKAGEILAQDEAAQMVSAFAAPQPGQTVIDLAAAPGGKSTHLAQLIGDKGRVIACDVAPKRLELVRQNADRLGLKSIETQVGDARTIQAELPPADLVLLDAPCSGTGTLRRRPDGKWKNFTKQIPKLAQLQAELLDSAAQLVKPGGALVYSTCSLEPEENQQQVAGFLQRHADWKMPASTMNPELFDSDMLFLWPQKHGTDGAFAARLQKKR